MQLQEGDFTGSASGDAAVSALRQVMLEKEKTRRLLIGAACFFLCIAALITVFAPREKQTMAYVLGAALLVMAVGAIGVAQFKIKVPGVELSGNRSLISPEAVTNMHAPWGETLPNRKYGSPRPPGA